MAWEPPTAAQISQSLRAAVRAELPAADPGIWPNNLYVVCKVMAQALRAAYLRLAWLRRQMFAATADIEALEMHGADVGIARLGATVAAGTANYVATVDGATVAVGTRFLRSDGAVFLAGEAGTIESPGGTIALVAAFPGRAGNTAAGAVLVPETAIAGIASVTVTGGGLSGGGDRETVASFRARVLDRKRNPPHGGSPAEYRNWARTMPGVTRVYVRRATPAPGSVTILFMMDDAYVSGIPQGGDIIILSSLLNSLAPANADIVVAAPTEKTVNVTVNALTPDTAAVRAAVVAELRAMFRRRAEPGSATADFVFSRSWIAEAVAMATGETRHRLTAPADDVTCGDGEIAVLGAVSFT